MKDKSKQELLDQIEELKILVDGAYEIVEIWDASESPYNKIWKENWLTKAREFGIVSSY